MSRRVAPTTKAQAKEIRRMSDEGMRPAQMGLHLGLSVTRIRRIATRFQITLPRSSSRRFGFNIAEKHALVVMELAEQAGITPSEMAARIARAVVGDGTTQANRILGKQALPLKKYGRKA